jgi:hypothetical protein
MRRGHRRTWPVVAGVVLVAAGCLARPPVEPTPRLAPSAARPTPEGTGSDGPPATASPLAAIHLGALITEPFSGIGNQYLFAATRYQDGFVAVGEEARLDGPVDGAVWVSANRSDWTRLDTVANDLADAEIDFVAARDETIIAIGVPRPGGRTGQMGSIVWRSEDGRAWRRVSTLPGPFGDIAIGGLIAGRAGFLAWGQRERGAAMFLSPDGIEWQQVAAVDGVEIRSVAGFRDGFVAVGSTRPPPAGGLVA